MKNWRSPHDSHSSFHLGKKNALVGAIFLSVLAFFLQVGGAWYTGSLALMGDSAHLFTDLISLVLSLAAVILASRPTTEVQSFGLFRLEVLATFVNGILLFAVSLGLLVECAGRLWHPEPVKALPLLWIAVIGLAFNLLSAFLLHRASKESGATFVEHHHHHHHDHAHDHCHGHHEEDNQHHADRNMRSALLHIWSDALNSVAVIVGAVIVHFSGFYWVDTVVGIGIALFILRWSINVLRDSGHVLLEGTPRHVDTTRLQKELRAIDSRVLQIEDLHVWEITSRMYAATAEVKVKEMNFNDAEVLRNQMHKHLHDHFGIAHAVLAIRPSLS